MEESRPPCPKCNHNHIVKNGHVKGIQRWKCRGCEYEFTRTTPRGVHPALKALAVLMYSTGKSSYGMIARLLNVSSVAVYKWIRKTAEQIPVPLIDADMKEVEFDEMWHFIESKKTNFGSGKRWIVLIIEPSPGHLAIVILPPSKNFTTG